jgi:hypothetical protein
MDISLVKTAIDMYQSQYNATDKLWAYFSTVSLALVAYTISSDKVTRIFPEAIAAIGAYWVFCIGNFLALKKSQLQLIELGKIVQAQGKAQSLDLDNFEAFSGSDVTSFYWLVVAAIAIASLAIVRYRGRKPNGQDRMGKWHGNL